MKGFLRALVSSQGEHACSVLHCLCSSYLAGSQFIQLHVRNCCLEVIQKGVGWLSPPDRCFKFPDAPFILQQCVHRDCHSRSLEQARGMVSGSLKQIQSSVNSLWSFRIYPDLKYFLNFVFLVLSSKVLFFMPPAFIFTKKKSYQSKLSFSGGCKNLEAEAVRETPAKAIVIYAPAVSHPGLDYLV